MVTAVKKTGGLSMQLVKKRKETDAGYADPVAMRLTAAAG
jgi:hypothetical protein